METHRSQLKSSEIHANPSEEARSHIMGGGEGGTLNIRLYNILGPDARMLQPSITAIGWLLLTGIMGYSDVTLLAH